MSLPEALLLAVALLVGVPSAWRNPTAAALVVAYAAAETILPPKLYIFPDIFTVAVIFSKPRYRPCQAYWDLSTREQLKCILVERSPADRFVLLSLPMAWYFYAPVLSYTQWWSLWWIAVAQFLVVGWESLSAPFRRHAEAMNRPPADPGALLVAYPGGGGDG